MNLYLWLINIFEELPCRAQENSGQDLDSRKERKNVLKIVSILTNILMPENDYLLFYSSFLESLEMLK